MNGRSVTWINAACPGALMEALGVDAALQKVSG